ncbi:hypothetical protein U1Q18_044829 [Sarracenia purpurea var. burkii]
MRSKRMSRKERGRRDLALGYRTICSARGLTLGDVSGSMEAIIVKKVVPSMSPLLLTFFFPPGPATPGGVRSSPHREIRRSEARTKSLLDGTTDQLVDRKASFDPDAEASNQQKKPSSTLSEAYRFDTNDESV